MGSITRWEEEEEGELEWSSEAVVYVNGVRRVLPDGLAHLTLLQYLRDLGLTGTKLGCGEGGCGACTVMVSNYNQETKNSMHFAINACLAPLYSVEGMHIITVEGIGDCQSGLHPIQESLAKSHGSQCGFCTPGFVMSMYALLRSNKNPPTEEQIEETLAGNLCRCTGYRPIIDAFRIFAKTDNLIYCNYSQDISSMVKSSENGEFICPSTGKPCSCGESEKTEVKSSRNEPICYNEIDGNKYYERELIFPPELVKRTILPLKLKGFGGINWYRPSNLQQVLKLKKLYPDSKLVIGNSEIGIESKFKNAQYKTLISTIHVPELNILNIKEQGIEIGASVRLSKLEQTLIRVLKDRKPTEVSSCKAILSQLKYFAGTQIRNVSSIGGNICTASPISDLNPLWMACNASFQIINSKGNLRSVKASDFFLGYRKVDLGKDEILLSVFLPWTRSMEFVKEFKQAHRRDDDIALVNAGMRVYLSQIDGGDLVISEISLVYGGVAAVPLAASKTAQFLLGRNWDQNTMLKALDLLKDEVALADEAPGGMVEFRRSLTLSFFFKFFMWVKHELSEIGVIKEGLSGPDLSAVEGCKRGRSSASQDYEPVRVGTAVGLPAPHLSANLQVTGEAEYTDDTPTPPNTLHAAFIISKKPHAKIISVDDSLARSSNGFAGLFLADDVPASNVVGPIVLDEELFASKVVTCVGQAIGIVVADTHENAKAAANKIKIEYEDLPAILSIKDAIDSKSFIPNTERVLMKGDVDKCFESDSCDKIIEGEVQVGGQEHFYMEPQCCLVWPVDCGHEIHMISSTQAPQNSQAYVSKVLGIPFSKVVCRTKRIGGGFGGKETRSAFIAAAAAVAAYKLRRPVKMVLDRDVDMMTTGHRHSFLGKYKVGFTTEGRIVALDLEIYSNGGNSLDLSSSVLERSMFFSENVYGVPNIRVRGRVCFTNFPSNTAFRGFGAPQGMVIAENWVQRVAVEVGKSPEEIRV